jgi:hypothetical protein
MRASTITAAALAALTLAAAAPAHAADTLVAAAPGAKNLASGGGYLAWAAPAPGGGHVLTVRAPDGTITTPDVPRFRRAPDPAIGSDRFGADGRRLLAVYARDGDLFALDLRTFAEERVAGASTRAYEESAPDLEFGRMTFVRRGGRDNGVFYRDGEGRLRRLTRAVPRETSMSASRVAYTSGRNLVIRRLSGRGRPSIVPTPSPAFSLVLTRYTLTWAVRGGRLFQTPRFGGSSEVERVSSRREATRTFPASTDSFAFSGSFVRFVLDAEGVKRIGEANVFSR